MPLRDLEGATLGLDTSALIPAFDTLDQRHEQVVSLLRSVAESQASLLISTIVVAESLIRPLRFRMTDHAARIRRFLLARLHVAICGVDWRLANAAAAIRARHGIQLPDAIVIATAKRCDAFVSSDHRALEVARFEGIRALSLASL